jgi:hypothetical protein
MFRSMLHSPDDNGAGEPSQPDLMGYKSVDDLVAAKRASDQELRRINDRLQGLEQSFQQAQRPQIPTRFSSPDEELSTYGVPIQALDAYVNQRLENAFKPIAQGMHARNEVISQNPDYGKYESEIAQFIGRDQTLSQRYQRMFQTDPAGAMEYAMLKYTDAQRVANPTPKKSESSRDAAIPSSRSGDTRNGETSNDQDLVQRAGEHYQKTGNPNAYAQARIRQVIKDDFLNR